MDVKRQIYNFDAAGRSLGRLATEIARLLMGKHKASYLPYKDLGDTVIIKNVDKLKIFSSKLGQKKYYHFSGYPGGLKTKKFIDLFHKKPTEVLRRAVYNMLPKNKLRKTMIVRLKFETKN